VRKSSDLADSDVGLLWENLAQQLESVRAQSVQPESVALSASREARLLKALKAVENSGNSVMIASLKAALEGREATLELPPVNSGPAAFLKALESKPSGR